MAGLRGPKSVQVSLNLPVLRINGTWEPNDDERKAAWELYVELVTRISVVPLGPDEGAAARGAVEPVLAAFGQPGGPGRPHGPAGRSAGGGRCACCSPARRYVSAEPMGALRDSHPRRYCKRVMEGRPSPTQ